MKQQQKSQNKAIFWDYDMKTADLNNPRVKRWYLSRKLQFGDLSHVKKSDLKKYLPQLDISPSLKELFQNYFKSK